MISKGRVARLMREEGIQGCYRKAYRVTTQSNHTHPIAGNIIDRDFNPTRPDHTWAGDITYIRTNEGWLYLAVIMDLFSRRIIGWAMDKRLKKRLTERALEMALINRDVHDNLIHHSDQGKQYAAQTYQEALAVNKIRCSMSRRGNCWDNAVVESFFKTLKVECVYHHTFYTRREAKHVIFDYIECFYNRKRRHSTIGYKSPVDYEKLHMVA